MAALPYMPLYIADYMADAAHLSTIEHGAYLLLIMTYWQRGEPLPSDDRKLSRIARMTPDEWTDARELLAEFFQDDGTVWRHKRIDSELAKVAEKSEKARTARAQRTHNERTTGVERPRYHTDTDTDTEVIPPSPIGDAPPKAKKASRLPDKWQPSDEDRTFAEQSGVDVDREAAKFRDYWQAKSGKDATKLDWSAMWRNWVRKAVDDQAKRKPDRQHDPTAPAKRYTPTEAEMRTAVRKWKGGGAWPAYLGPRPDMVSTNVPKHILTEEGV